MVRIINPGEKENPLKILWSSLWDTFSSLDKFTKLFIIVAVLVVGVTPIIVNNRQIFEQHAARAAYNLKSYYPNPNLFTNNYLEGKNYIKAPATRSVLWFEPQDQWSFKQYNYGPEDVNKRCHYDLMSWWDDGFLRYVKTVDNCPGHTPNEIVYDPPIVYLPRNWDSTLSWSLSGTSTAKYYINNNLTTPVCEGVIGWNASIVGIDGVNIHFVQKDKTTWTKGNLAGHCSPGAVTNWQEDYWLTDVLPIQSGGAAKAIKRSKGGNLDVPSDSWDIWFDKWAPLPWASSTPAPSVTPTIKPSIIPMPSPIRIITPSPVGRI